MRTKNETKKNALTLPDEVILNKFFLIRGKKIMLDVDLANLYGVTTSNLNKAVKRNIKRFPNDFMFRLTKTEFKNLIFQIGTSSWGGTRKMPYAFAEQGVAMLSGILSSDRAITVNIQIMRIYIKMKEMVLTHKDILLKLELLEKQVSKHSKEIRDIFEVLKQLVLQPIPPRNQIGFNRSDEK
ncbi:MAG: ORF6N domain-containing protein [Bacteroidia bacterium]